jgi:hypothetical protein
MASDLDIRPKLWNTDMRLGTWNVRSLYRAGSLMTVAKEISKYNLDLVGVQIRRDWGGTETAGDSTFFCGKGDENHELGIGFFVHKKIVEFVSDRMSYITKRSVVKSH